MYDPYRVYWIIQFLNMRTLVQIFLLSDKSPMLRVNSDVDGSTVK